MSQATFFDFLEIELGDGPKNSRIRVKYLCAKWVIGVKSLYQRQLDFAYRAYSTMFIYVFILIIELN